MLKSLSRFLSAALVVSMLGATMPAPVSARMIGSEETLSAAQVDADRATISAWLARAEVRDELVAMGVSPAEVEARVAA
ncbi:MAG: PA2779 family protein, partial [Gammaproteobacteria bacterium]